MIDAERELESYVAMLQKYQTRLLGKGYRYGGPDDALATDGRMWPVAADQSPGEKVVSVPKKCFDNAYRLARTSKNLRYCEGYALGVIPLKHAWVVNEQNEVIDPTWHMLRSGLGTAYYGRRHSVEAACSRATPGLHVWALQLDAPLPGASAPAWIART